MTWPAAVELDSLNQEPCKLLAGTFEAHRMMSLEPEGGGAGVGVGIGVGVGVGLGVGVGVGDGEPLAAPCAVRITPSFFNAPGARVR